MIADMYENGLCVAKDSTIAVELLKKAIAQDQTKAQDALKWLEAGHP